MATIDRQALMSLETAVEVFVNQAENAANGYLEQMMSAIRIGENLDINERDAFQDMMAAISEAHERVRVVIRSLASDPAVEAAA
jgi:hypothetical protein